ncbi:MAG: DUF2235 domain-containing protein [Desulfobacterales bacterium]|nr:DUF2235 domain-containing protein [Desulfobacterales bacterium]
MSKIILCFDGTSNDPKDAKQKRNLKMELKDASVSNIFKLHLLLGGELRKGKDAFFPEQKSFYYSGVGTYGSKFVQWFNAALALPNMDVAKIINKAVDDLSKIYKNGDEVFVFGFSRGAAIARRFAAVVDEKIKDHSITIRFLGVFDTVASIGYPNLDDDSKPVSDVRFENCTLADNVEEALHMLSLDEKRTAFMPTLMADDKRVTEIWFAGAHSDIGGGYRYDGLADIALHFLIEEFTRRNLGLEVRTPLQIDFDRPEYKKMGLAYDDMAIQPNPLGKSHQQDRSFLLEWTLSDRDMRVHTENAVPPNGPALLPKVHYTVMERIHGDSDYRPVSLSRRTLDGEVENQVPHCIWRPDGEKPKTVYGLAEHLKKGPPAAKKLEIGQERKVTVYANQKLNRSYVYANRGERYSFKVKMDQKWFDSGIICDPAGWDRDSEDFPWYQDIAIKFMEDERRCPAAKWFEIVGVVGKKSQVPFQALEFNGNKDFEVKENTGEFFLFANDLEDRYSNNLGFIEVRIARKG